MFADRVLLHCRAGDGGRVPLVPAGKARAPRGAGRGDGGDGGDIVIRASPNVGSLIHLVGIAHHNAERGQHGQGSQKTGPAGRA